MTMGYDVRSPKAEEFISHEEILETLAYAQEHKEDLALVDAILEKARPKPRLRRSNASGGQRPSRL